MLWAAGTLLIVLHARAMTAANPGRALPWTGRAPGWTLRSSAFYGLGLFGALLGSASAHHQIGSPAAYGVGLVCLLVPLLGIQGVHNRRVRKSRAL